MKILIVGQTYVPAINRDKLHYLNKKAEITLLTPPYWNDDLFHVPGTRDSEVKHHMENVLPNGQERASFYFPNLGMHIKETKPDIIQVDQGANALTYLQAITINKLFSIGAKMCFFTWMNVPYSNPFPFSLIEKCNLKNTDLAICGNQDAANLLRKKSYNGPITVMPLLGVDTKKFTQNAKTRRTVREKIGIRDETCIAFFGRLVVEKGVDDLINAVHLIKNKKLKLLIIGSGPEKDNLQKLVKQLGMAKQVIMLNSVLHDELPKYFSAIDIFVLPSKSVPLWREQFGHVAIEAMSAEVPVIGSTCGEIPNVVGDAGLIFQEGNAGQLAKQIEKLTNDAKLRKQLGHKGKQRVLKNYTHRIIAEKMLEAYKKILVKKP